VTGERLDPTPHVPAGPVPSSAEGRWLLDLVKVMERLRAPGGCPWDREQTHQTLARHLLEETHELLDAIDGGDTDAIRDELGDLLLQVVFHAQIAADEERWDVDDVARRLVEKLVHRHPHVFGDVEVSGADEVLTNWERLKAEEAGARGGVDEEIPATLPALARAAKVQRRAAGAGFDLRSKESALAKVQEELAELGAAAPERVEEELGDVLFAVAAFGRQVGLDPETALRKAVRRFSDRFERMKARVEADGVVMEELSDDELLSRFRAAR
jgi:MazG family protein